MAKAPWIVSVDDHIVEPPDLFEGRLPAKYQDLAPHVERTRLRFVGGTRATQWIEDEDGDWCDAWRFEGVTMPLMWLVAAVGRETSELDLEVATYDEIHPGTWKQAARLEDMTTNHVEAAMCFPNMFRFAGQTFSENSNRELGLACIQAYNDWVIEDWGGGAGKGRLLPVTLVPLWDPDLASAEIGRCAEKGSFLLSFPENPCPLGFPSLYEPADYWKPVFDACQETNTIINMHIGSSSQMAHLTPKAPFIVQSTQTYLNSQNSFLDFMFSGTFARYPKLKVSYSESQVGWLPYTLERADKLWEDRGANDFGSWLPDKPSSYMSEHIYFCIYDDPIGLRLRDLIGIDQILFETDYPHADSTFPNTEKVFGELCAKAGLDETETYKLARGSAIRGLGLDRYGITA